MGAKINFILNSGGVPDGHEPEEAPAAKGKNLEESKKSQDGGDAFMEAQRIKVKGELNRRKTQ